MLSVFFVIIPALYFVIGGEIISYSWRNFIGLSYVIYSEDLARDGLASLIFCMLAFSLGAVLSQYRSARKKPYKVDADQNVAIQGSRLLKGERLRFIMYIYFGVWCCAALYYFSQAGFSISQWLLPISNKTSDRVPAYIKIAYMTIPIALYAMSYWQSGKITKTGWFFILIGAMSAFSTHQRREAVTLFIFVACISILSDRKIFDREFVTVGDYQTLLKSATKRIRWRGALILGLGVVLVPLLWYSRVYFTASSEGLDVDVFEIRSFTEVLFGSPATGYPTYLLILDYVQRNGPDIFYLPRFLATLPIPRELWADKTSDLDTILETYFRLMENPSAFWFGELQYMFGFVTIPASFVLGYWLHRSATLCFASTSLLHRAIGAALIMQSITFFKNGLLQFSINFIGIWLFLLIAWKFAANIRSAPQRTLQKKHVLKASVTI